LTPVLNSQGMKKNYYYYYYYTPGSKDRWGKKNKKAKIKMTDG